MARSSSSSSSSMKALDYPFKSIHYLVATRDHKALSEMVSSLPQLGSPLKVNSMKEYSTDEENALKISKILDNQDNEKRDTALHVAVRLNDLSAVKILILGDADAAAAADATSEDEDIFSTGANVNLPNAKGWTALQEAVLNRSSGEIIKLILEQKKRMLWFTWRRRLPLLTQSLRSVPNFFLEISVGFESSVVSFAELIPKTIKIWKIDGNLRLDMPFLSWFEDLSRGLFGCLNLNRWKSLENHRLVFFGDGNQSLGLAEGAFIIKNLDKSGAEHINLFGDGIRFKNQADVVRECSQTKLYKLKMNFSKAELHRKGKNAATPPATATPATTDHVDFGVWKNANLYEGRKFSLDYTECEIDLKSAEPWMPPETKEKVYKTNNLKPSFWLTEAFPLKINDLKPILNLLGEEMREFARVMELIKSLGGSSFPVKMSIPIVPSIKMVATVTRFSIPPEGAEDPFDNPF